VARSVKALIDGRDNEDSWDGALHVAGAIQDIRAIRQLLTGYLKYKGAIR
jgi:hypothetical protein